MNLNDLFNEEKVRLDPKCWTGKKIGNPKTKMKGGVRVNNCVPAESVAEQSNAPSTGPRDPRLGEPGSEKHKRISATLKQDSAELAKWAKQQQADEIAAGRKINFLGIGDMLNKEDELRNQKAAAAKAPTSSQSVELPSGNGTGGAKSLTKKVLGKVGRTVMPTLGFTDAAERLSNKDYTGAGISAAAGGIGLIPAWPAQVASGGLELVNMTRDEANALGGYDKLAKEISKNFTPEYDPSYLPENPTQSEGLGTLYNRGKDFVRYLRRNDPVPLNPNASQDMATQRNVGGKAIPSLGEPGKVVTSKTADKALTKLGGKNVDTTPGPTVKSGSSNDLNLDPVFDVPAYVRQGKSDPVTVPKPGSKPTIKIQPGETMIQAMQRAKDEQEFGKFLQGQGGQKFGTSTAAPTSGANQVPTVKLPGGQTIPDPYRVSPSGQYNTPSGRLDKIERDDKIAVDAMVKRARQSALDREAREKTQSDSIQPVQPSWKNRNTDVDLEEQSRKKREQPEAKYDDEYDAMVARVKKLAGIGPMKTVYDPKKRVYRNMPTAQQPKK